jgi:hypothetical protein
VLTGAALAGLIVAVYRIPGTANPQAVWAAAGVGVALFLVVRWLQNYLWGVLAGLLVALHPLYQETVNQFHVGLLAGALTWGLLACMLLAWRLAFQPRFAWRCWAALAVVFPVGIALTWALQPRAGLVAAALTHFGLIGTAFLAAAMNSRGQGVGCSWWNVTAAALIGLLAPLGGVLLAPEALRLPNWPQPQPVQMGEKPGFSKKPGFLPPQAQPIQAGSDWQDMLEAALGSNLDDYRFHGFNADQVRRWGWPQEWVVLPLVVWGFWRTIRRGWREWARRRPPLAWALTLFAIIDLLGVSFHPWADTGILSLASLAVALVVFGVADVVRGFMERLVLAPPQERDAG